jgi:hypothetical protein
VPILGGVPGGKEVMPLRKRDLRKRKKKEQVSTKRLSMVTAALLALAALAKLLAEVMSLIHH